MLVHEKFSELPEKNKTYRCPMCHEEVKGRRGLTMHLKRTHFSDDYGTETTRKLRRAKAIKGSKIDWSRKRFDPVIELKIQELVVKTVYGMAKVNSVISDYVSGKYSKKTLPINIGYYITLKGITQDKENKKKDQGEEKRKKLVDKEKSSEIEDHKNITAEDLLGNLMKISKSEDIENIVIGIKYNDDQFEYVSDLMYNISEEVMKISTTSNKDEILNESEAIHYLTKYDEDIDNSDFILKIRSKKVINISQKIKGNRAWLILETFMEK